MTREIFVKWRDENQSDWDWRLSMADIIQSGAFSLFPGVDRSIAVLQGRGVILYLAKDQFITVDQSTEPLTFAGELTVSSSVIGGPTTDLNMMTKRKDFRHTLRKHHCTATSSFELGAGWNALVANTALALRYNGKHIGVQRFETVIDLGSEIEVTPVVKGDCYLINVRAI